MSIKVQNISKIYGKQKALNDISFEVKSAEIVGFLGPNGAGKSTTMKILTCFIPQTSGTASVCGFDISEQSLDVRRNVGYLAENNPLYYDMFVKEYLGFVAELHGLKNADVKVKEIIRMTGLEVEQKKKIGALSKGYKQRIGLAQALIHDPKVLILDEPTSGLDPIQLVEIRNVIKEIGKEKTVMLSTHIMQEVEAMCDRVIIINKGQIVADKPTQEMKETKGSRQLITVEFDKTVSKNSLKDIKGVNEAINIKGNTWQLTTSASTDIRGDIFQFAVKNQLSVLTLQKEDQNLEDVFRELTK
ncbi:MAG: gliding motility-associated ABC transporter ATP-binding subunit GldA [Bacteroidetes bacterium]|nr:MAG: gliding motility-associated ABC transporter ATP-binding subunit GldA [Bacteroidota bacterium]